MGAKTITRYENGTIQERTHDNLIRAVNNNFVFSDFITREKKSNVSDLKNYEIKGDKLYFNLEKIEQQKAKCFAFKKSNILESKKKYAEIKLCAWCLDLNGEFYLKNWESLNINRKIEITLVQILFPYLRAAITNITALTDTTTITLPIVNVANLLQRED